DPRRSGRGRIPGRARCGCGNGAVRAGGLHAGSRPRRRVRRALRRVRDAARLLRPRLERCDAPASRDAPKGVVGMTGDGSQPILEAVRRNVCDLHAELVRYRLVAWTSGNVSGRVPGTSTFVIKPSG